MSDKKEPDYKALYDNLSKRIGRLHAFASSISTGGHYIMGRGKCLDRDVVSHILKRIAFGQP